MGFKENILTLYGENGKKWLDELPTIIEALAHKYSLKALKPLDNLSYNYVLSAKQNSKDVILKISINSADLQNESKALKAFAKFGVVEILAEEDGILLLEKAATSLKKLFPNQDDEAIEITASIINKLHQAQIHENFPKMEDIFNSIQNVPSEYLNQAKSKIFEPHNVLLHGDLHHDNILQNGSEWLVIDPKGFIGDRAYEVAIFIRNPAPYLLEQKNHMDIIKNRIAKFANKLELSEEHIIHYCLKQSLIALSWAREDGTPSQYFERITEIFYQLHL